MTDEMPKNEQFDRWCFSAVDNRVMLDGKPLPVLTVVLHRACGGDNARFTEALRALQVAFEAGAASARVTP